MPKMLLKRAKMDIDITTIVLVFINEHKTQASPRTHSHNI